METFDIIKEAFVFPADDITKLAIYIALTLVCGFLAVGGIALIVLGAIDNTLALVLGILLFVFALIIGFILSGYQISIIKSGIDHTYDVPEFNWKGNFITGIKNLIVTIVYFIIPAIVVLIVSWATNLFGQSRDIFLKIMYASINAPANATVDVSSVVPHSAFVSLGTAMIITGIVAVMMFIIFAFIHTMGESRLANTDSLGDALNIVEAFKDIGRIGYGKVIAVVILIFVIIAVINIVLTGLNNYIGGIGILSIVITPYLIFFASRATGLLYSDIV